MANDISKVLLSSGVLKINGSAVGYLKDPVESIYKVYEKDIEAGSESSGLLMFQGGIPFKVEHTLRASQLEFTAANVSKALGGAAITTVNATPVVVTSLTAQMEAFGGVQRAFIGGGVITSGPTVTLPDLTPCVEDTDYVVDHTDGYIIRIPGGNISSLGFVVLSGEYTPYASSTIKYGIIPARTQYTLEFIAAHPETADKFHVYMPKCEANKDLKFSFGAGGEPVNIDVLWRAVDDRVSSPTQPMGYAKWEVI